MLYVPSLGVILHIRISRGSYYVILANMLIRGYHLVIKTCTENVQILPIQ